MPQMAQCDSYIPKVRWYRLQWLNLTLSKSPLPIN